MAERLKRVTEAEAMRARDMGLGLGIEVIPDHPQRVLTETLALGRLHGLTVYNASYLDLAMREGTPLATLGGPLANAARRAGVPLVEP